MTLVLIRTKIRASSAESELIAAKITGKPMSIVESRIKAGFTETIGVRVSVKPEPPGIKLEEGSFTNLKVDFVFNNDFFNTATLYYSNDYVSGDYLRTLRKSHVTSIDNFGVERERVFYSDGIADDGVADFYLNDLLTNHALPNYVVSFVYNGDRSHVTPGSKFRVDLSHLPGPDGVWVDAACTAVSTKRKGGSISVVAVTQGNWDLPTRIVTKSLSSSASGGGVVLTTAGSQTVLTIREAGAGSPVLPDIRVEINGEVKYTDTSGQVAFDLAPGTYTIIMQGSGYLATSGTITVQ